MIGCRFGVADVHIGECSITKQIQSAAVAHRWIGSHLGNAGIVVHLEAGHGRIVTYHERCEGRGEARRTEACKTVIAQIQTFQATAISSVQGQLTSTKVIFLQIEEPQSTQVGEVGGRITHRAIVVAVQVQAVDMG